MRELDISLGLFSSFPCLLNKLSLKASQYGSLALASSPQGEDHWGRGGGVEGGGWKKSQSSQEGCICQHQILFSGFRGSLEQS